MCCSPHIEPAKLRTSAPDSDACGGCHAQPEAGGAADFVANVFVLAQTLDPVTFPVAPEFSNDRNTLGMHGSGAIEMLAREMTVDLQSQAAGIADGAHTLTTKGVDFDVTGSGGEVVAADGVNADLVVRPFHQAGVVVSLREFTDNANHHHGMQAEERFGLNPARGFDSTQLRLAGEGAVTITSPEPKQIAEEQRTGPAADPVSRPPAP